jgi:hypothetical protein
MLLPTSIHGIVGEMAQPIEPAEKMASAIRYAPRAPAEAMSLAERAEPIIDATTNNVVLQA